MKKILKSPVFNACCIILFTTFYSLIFLTLIKVEKYEGESVIWKVWNSFLDKKYHYFIVFALILITIIIAIILFLRRQNFDEYHFSILTYCLIFATILTLLAIAIFFLVILWEESWFFGKFILFIAVHWIIVVFSNLIYLISCRQK